MGARRLPDHQCGLDDTRWAYVPHCFYFGPGFLASLHLAAAFAPEVAFELFFGDLQASPYHDAVRARQGRLSVPPGPGWDSIRIWRYSIATASAPRS